MSILETVEQVIAQVEGDLTNQAEGLVSELQDTATQVTDVQSQLDTEWDEVSSKGQSMLSQAQEAEGKIQQAGDELASKADEIRSNVDSAVEQGETAFEAARTVVESLDQGVQALIPDADAIMAQVDETVNTLASEVQNLDQALEQTRLLTDEYLHAPFQGLVDDVKNEIFNRASELGSYVDNDFLTAAADQISAFKGHVDEVVTTATDKLEEVRNTAESEGSSAMDQMGSIFGDQFGELIGTVETISQFMTQVGGLMETLGETVGTTTKVMSAGAGTTAIGAKSAIGVIEDIVEIFQSVV